MKTGYRTLTWLATALLVALVVPPSAGAVGPPITDYVLYGVNGVSIGAGSIITGLVGAENNKPGTNAAILLNGGGTTVIGNARSGGSVRVGNGARITGTVFHPAGTSVILGGTATVGGEIIGDPELPGLPAASVFACPTGGASHTGANGQSLSLGPGTHGTLQFGSNFTLTLTGAGDYFFDSVTAGSGAKVIVNATPVRIFVCDKMRFTGSVQVLPDTLTNTDITVEALGSGLNTIQIGGGSAWIGDLFAPNGVIHVGGGGCCTTFLGRLWADQIDLEHAVQNTPPIPGDNGEEFPPKDATLLHGAKNQNNGGTQTLRVLSQGSAVVGFDVSGYGKPFNQVTSALLVVTVCSDPIICPDSPSNWPSSGGNVFAYRLATGFEFWVEGTGINFGPGAVSGNTGQGVTFNCPTDNDISNSIQECIGVPTVSWGGSGGVDFLGPARGPVKHFNSFTDGQQVVFDVTADVQAGLGTDTKFMTFFIRKPSGSGFVEYYSREGASAVGNTNLAPKLLISP